MKCISASSRISIKIAEMQPTWTKKEGKKKKKESSDIL
jgi:hypothetical protein